MQPSSVWLAQAICISFSTIPWECRPESLEWISQTEPISNLHNLPNSFYFSKYFQLDIIDSHHFSVSLQRGNSLCLTSFLLLTAHFIKRFNHSPYRSYVTQQHMNKSPLRKLQITENHMEFIAEDGLSLTTISCHSRVLFLLEIQGDILAYQTFLHGHILFYS